MEGQQVLAGQSSGDVKEGPKRSGVPGPEQAPSGGSAAGKLLLNYYPQDVTLIRTQLSDREQGAR